MPAFWPEPEKLKPCTVNTDSTVFFSSLRKWSCTLSSTWLVRIAVAPTGACTNTSIQPWSSSGRNEVGRRMNSRPMSAASTA